MRVLVFWDIYGRVWRNAFVQEYNKLVEEYSPDFTIANIENITSWKWPITQHAELIAGLWVDVMTWWDHVFDNMENIKQYFDNEDCQLIRPANFCSENMPWTGSMIIEKNNKSLLVVQVLGQAFMSHNVDNPFLAIEKEIELHAWEKIDGIIVDFHRETTAELYGMAHFLNGRVALVYGTHTHIQTNDAHILSEWTWLIGDVGMNWPFNSVIGADYDSVKKRFLTGIQRWKIEQALGKEFIINAVLVDIEDWKTSFIENISYTWKL